MIRYLYYISMSVYSENSGHYENLDLSEYISIPGVKVFIGGCAEGLLGKVFLDLLQFFSGYFAPSIVGIIIEFLLG